jgi:DNA-binding response OmpR family regulator
MNKKKKILVVDDRKKWLSLIGLILGDEYELVLVNNVAKAGEVFSEIDFDLVILDKNLPEEDAGLDLLKNFRGLKPRLPAIILTHFESVASAVESMKLGAADYLPKSTEKLEEVLPQKVREILDRNVSTELNDLISMGESSALEFKSSLRWDIRANKLNRDLEKVIVKTIASFMNAENESNLLIGVEDTGEIIGLQNDFKTLGKKQDRDGFENLLITLILDACGKDCIPLLKVKFYQAEGKEVCCVTVKPSKKPIFVTDDKTDYFYVRTGNSTRLLSTRETMEYCKIRFP